MRMLNTRYLVLLRQKTTATVTLSKWLCWEPKYK